ncbi:MAG: FAD-binding oxidoreductase [Gammaproteobacteria bacterium]|nr:FAD-binding oxidoreductase [Gammaproteobacteria bacterium]
MPLSPEHVSNLVAIVGADSARGAADLATLDPGVDPRNLGAGLMLRPRSTDALARALAYCNERRIGVVPQGGRTGLSGGAESRDDEVIVALDRFSQIESLDPMSRTAIVGAGVTLAALAERAAAHRLAPGIDLGARDGATIGGLVSTNAGGNAAFRHGTMRERVLGLEAVLADGTVLSELGRVRKRNEGLAIEQLFIGAEGTLGVVTRVALALVERGASPATALIAVPSLDAAAALCDAARRHPDFDLQAVELMSGNHAAAACRAAVATELMGLAAHPYLVLVEVTRPQTAVAEAALIAWLEDALARGLVADAAIAQNDTQRLRFWRIREDWAVDRERPGGLWYDVSVPLAALPAYVDACRARLASHDPALALYVIGHLGDGNLHLTVNAERPIVERYEEIAPLVTDELPALGGSFSAEHGIGLEKKATLHRLGSPARLERMRRVKAVFDPNGIMNPGKVL